VLVAKLLMEGENVHSYESDKWAHFPLSNTHFLECGVFEAELSTDQIDILKDYSVFRVQNYRYIEMIYANLYFCKIVRCIWPIHKS
jgi:hypothetical protein